MPGPTSLAGGRYRLVALIGEGATATVHRAWDQDHERWCAIKLLSPVLARYPAVLARFEREARVLAALDHPHIVRAHGLERTERAVFLVMELVGGGSLMERVASHGALPPRMAVDAALQVADALRAAHAAGVVHRDIKPHNVLVAADGTCRVADFGIAGVTAAAQRITRTGVTMGTNGFMAPEQVQDAKRVDHRADVYALGALLYCLLSGRLPTTQKGRFGGQLDGMPAPLPHIIMRATLQDPAQRWADMDAIAARLARARPTLLADPPGTPALRQGGPGLAPVSVSGPTFVPEVAES